MKSTWSRPLSFPRRREPSRKTVFNWVPAFAGMTGLVLIGCSNLTSEEQAFHINEKETSSISEEVVILFDSDFVGKGLVKGMTMEEATKSLEFLGWGKWDGIRVSPTGMANLWMREPCRAAAVDYSLTYKTVSNERPPQHLLLNASFYECVDGKPVNMGQLAEVNIKEDIHAKNK